MALTCYQCGKVIKGKVVRIVPAAYAIRIGADFPRSYHPTCYARAERSASLDLRRSGKRR